MSVRSSIDLLSNQPILRDFSDARAIADAAIYARYPVAVLPQFLHELTHHWCFNSPVGLALSLLRLEAVSNSLKFDFSNNRARDLLVRYTVATALLRPIAEGLALFAEFDVSVASTYGELISAPMACVARHFPEPSLPPLQPPSGSHDRDVTPFVRPLFRLRTTSKLLDRKANVLTSGLSATGDAYLLGYLTVKSLWVQSFKRYPLLSDTDLFQILLRSYIFGDNVLAALLLDCRPATDGNVACIADYIARRLHQFCTFEHDRFVPLLQIEMQPWKAGPLIEVEKVPWETDVVRQRSSVACNAAVDRIGKNAASDNGKMFASLASGLLSDRTYMTVADIDVEYRRGNDGAVVLQHQGLPIFAMDTRGQEFPEWGRGRFAIRMVPTTGMQFCVFTLPGQKVFVDVVRSPDRPEQSLDANLFSRSTDNIVVIVEMTEKMALSRVGVRWNELTRIAREDCERIYTPLALAFAVDTEKTQKVMSIAGFWSLLDGDAAAVDQLVRLSCWSSIGLHADVLDALCDEHGFNRDESSLRLLDYCERTGFQFFAVAQDGRPVSLA